MVSKKIYHFIIILLCAIIAILLWLLCGEVSTDAGEDSVAEEAIEVQTRPYYEQSIELNTHIVYVETKDGSMEFLVPNGARIPITLTGAPSAFVDIVLPFSIYNDYHWRPENDEYIFVECSKVFLGCENQGEDLEGDCLYMQRLSMQVVDTTELTLFAYDISGKRMEITFGITLIEQND